MVKCKCGKNFIHGLALDLHLKDGERLSSTSPASNTLLSSAIFSGENSKKLWEEINSLNAMSTGDDVRDVLYSFGCAMQRLEAKTSAPSIDDLGTIEFNDGMDD